VKVSRALVLTAGIVALAAAPTLALAAGTTGTRRTIGVHDNYYAPSKVTVKLGTTIRWLWEDDATDVHDVKLTSAPKGVRKFASEPLAIGDTFSRKLTRPGTYKIICTFHEEEMRMTITVKRPVRRK
jgi:plastocyanin